LSAALVVLWRRLGVRGYNTNRWQGAQHTLVAFVVAFGVAFGDDDCVTRGRSALFSFQAGF
jgi:hypothetical protein